MYQGRIEIFDEISHARPVFTVFIFIIIIIIIIIINALQYKIAMY